MSKDNQEKIEISDEIDNKVLEENSNNLDETSATKKSNATKTNLDDIDGDIATNDFVLGLKLICRGIYTATKKTILAIKHYFETHEIARLSAILCSITSVTALLLGIVNGITAPIIEEIQIKATNEAMQVLVVGATDFERLEIPENSNPLVKEFYIGTNGADTVGYCIKVSPYGYGGPIEIVVALDNSGVVLGTEIIDHTETSNLGSKIKDDPSFSAQFIGKSTSLVITKTGATAVNEIDAISGATISSAAMTLGVSVAIEFVANNK